MVIVKQSSKQILYLSILVLVIPEIESDNDFFVGRILPSSWAKKIVL